jgi:uncharacterized repeat protein (TIGR02543 family)
LIILQSRIFYLLIKKTMKKAGYYVLLALGVGVAGYFTIQSVFPQDEEVVMYGEVDEARTKRASLQSMSCSATNAGTLRYSNGCFQYCDGKGVWINKGAGCDASSHTISCIGLPVANASWNTTSSITQTRNGDEWLPTAIGSYNTTASDNECRFTCNENYTYSGGDNTCIINTSTLTINPGGSTYIQDIGTTKSVSAPAGGSYIVSYNLNGGESTIPESSTSTQQFSGWTLTGGGNVLSTTTNPTTYTFGASNGMLTANYGNYPAITCPAAPIKAGYTFNGWYTAASQGTKRCDASTTYTPAQNETLYAQWSIACTVNSLGI